MKCISCNQKKPEYLPCLCKECAIKMDSHIEREDFQEVIHNLERTMTSKPIPTNIENFDCEDTWNSAMNFSLGELKSLELED